MSNFSIDLSSLKREDVFSVATALLYSLKDSSKYSTVSELFYILDYDNFINLIKYFGGQEIRIPSSDEVARILKVLLLYQYSKVENLEWSESLKKSGIREEDSLVARNQLRSLERIFQKYDIGERKYE